MQDHQPSTPETKAPTISRAETKIAVFKAIDQCQVRAGTGGQWYNSCEVAQQKIATDGLSPAGDNMDLRSVLDRLTFTNELTFVFVGRILPLRQARLSIQLPIQNTTREFPLVGPRRSPAHDRVSTGLRYAEAGAAKYEIVFPADGRRDNFITVSEDCELTVLSNITVPDVGALSVYVEGLVDYLNAMVEANDAVAPTNVAWDVVQSAAEQADRTLARVERLRIDATMRRQVANSRRALQDAVVGISQACGSGLPDRCSEQQAAGIAVIRTIHDQVRTELEAAKAFVDAERARLEEKAQHISQQLRDLLNSVNTPRERRPFEREMIQFVHNAEKYRPDHEPVVTPEELRPLETNGEIVLDVNDWDARFRDPDSRHPRSFSVTGDLEHPTMNAARVGGPERRPTYNGIGYSNTVSARHRGPLFSVPSNADIHLELYSILLIRTLDEIRRDRAGEYKLTTEIHFAVSGGFAGRGPHAGVWIRDWDTSNGSLTARNMLGGGSIRLPHGNNVRAGWHQGTVSQVIRFHARNLTKGLDVFAKIEGGRQVQFQRVIYEIERYVD